MGRATGRQQTKEEGEKVEPACEPAWVHLLRVCSSIASSACIAAENLVRAVACRK